MKEAGEKSSTSTESLDSSQDANTSVDEALGQKKETPDVEQPETPDQYPHGVKLILLAGSSMIAVFLIALDQVGCHLIFDVR
jgi:MFS transporter, DHA2 family, glioxin efflux transporter